MKRLLLLITYGWPSATSGCGIAVASSIGQYLRHYDRVHLAAVIDSEFRSADEWTDCDFGWTHVRASRPKRWLRFLLSLFSRYPAVSFQYRNEQVRRGITNIIADYQKDNYLVSVAFEGVAPSCLIDMIARFDDAIPTCVRSHDVIGEAFSYFQEEGSFLRRLAWRIEIGKIVRLERRTLIGASRFWAITREDADRYSRLYGHDTDGVFRVSADATRYAAVVAGNVRTVLSLGSADLLKGDGLRRFIANCWIPVHEALGDCRLVIGGRNTEPFTDEGIGVHGLGFVDSECEFLGKGCVFVNPQVKGSGIQLKSVVAMLSGKALISTALGLEGIPGEHGKHFFRADDWKELQEHLLLLMNDRKLAIEVGRNGRALCAEHFSSRTLDGEVDPLLAGFGVYDGERAAGESR